MPLPNFFVVGTGKAGTTSLFRYLQQHPQIFMSPVKEPSYFAAEIRAENLSAEFRRHAARQSGDVNRWLIADWDAYQRLFEGAGESAVAIGEATPSYLWSATAAANIHERLPHAKIVMILRDPAERAYSHYLALVTEGLIAGSFRDHLEQCVRATAPWIGPWYPFLEVGLYSEQVRRFRERFPREAIRIYWYEEAWREPAAFLRNLFAFLGVDPAFPVDFSARSLERRAPRFQRIRHALKKHDMLQPLSRWVPAALRKAAFQAAPRMTAEDRQWLVDYYRDDIRKLGALLDRDLGSWLRVTV